ncbi:RapZ C-terminal domain-containing protein [Herbidospora daliensis]|uniref:RapZ C-terminal domain-containing protein n=1 Tax=Herbidospora daliensis TaxID=295585 RepID=UPI000780F9A5|nr:RNase adapter RapZ [Herbidospora daliensis]
MKIRVKSFGFGHGAQPEADMTFDARRVLRNPHHDPAMRELTGLDWAVREHVAKTPGAVGIAVHLAVGARHLAWETGRDIDVAVGCAGGRHRAVALAEMVAAEVRKLGDFEVTVEHLHVDRPLLPLSAHREVR